MQKLACIPGWDSGKLDHVTKRRFWQKIRDNFLRPKVDDQQLERVVRELRQQLPIPVFWLLGKAQAGKTSLIRAITGTTRAEIGNGFRPCTRTTQIFAFPEEEDCLLKFMDTRGLGEVDYDPSEDLHVLEDQAHLLIVVLKALDHAQQCVLEPLRRIRQEHPQWPVIVVQTSLHEAYPSVESQHLVPYPFLSPPYPPQVPANLSRSLAAQRELFRDSHMRFVPVDFTLREDGYEIQNYGLDALWTAIEEALPLGLRGMLQVQPGARQSLRDMFFRKAHPHIVSYSLAAGAAAAVPVPLVDIPLVLSLQAKMCQTLASIYQQPMNSRRMAELGGALGIGFVTRLGGRELLKVIPGFGSVMAGLFAAASTYALGNTVCTYFSRVRHGDIPDAAMLKKLYAEQFEEGRKRLGPYFERWVPGHRNESPQPDPPQLEPAQLEPAQPEPARESGETDKKETP